MPSDDRIWEWGKHKGVPVQELRADYLEWVVENMTYEKPVRAAVKELQYRNLPVPKDRKVESPEERAAYKLQLELKRVVANIENITAGINRLLMASGLDAITLTPSVSDGEKKPYNDYKKKTVAKGYVEEEFDSGTPF